MRSDACIVFPVCGQTTCIIGALWTGALWTGHYALERCPIHESQDLASVGRHDLGIKALIKRNA